jgi:hypothetical protein
MILAHNFIKRPWSKQLGQWRRLLQTLINGIVKE